MTTQVVVAAKAAALPAQAGSSRGGGPSPEGSPNGVASDGDPSPSMRNTSSLSGDCGAMYALMTSSVTLPLLRQKEPRGFCRNFYLRRFELSSPSLSNSAS